MAEIVLFGGTSEGRALAELLQKADVPALVCVASDYGESLLSPGGSLRVHTGRLDERGMEALLAAERPRLALDATHPYATQVSDNLRSACRAAGVGYLRVCRETGQSEAGCLSFANMDALVCWLSGQEGVIFSSLGAKEAKALSRVRGFAERVFLRVLPSPESLRACLDAGFPPKHIVCMQGPFSRELNVAMFHAANARILLTKASGTAGGFDDKLAAARECGLLTAVLSRPEETDGLPLSEIRRRIEEGAL